ncbi:unnamed protein product [Moneuplotes crassus]|uniref:Rab GDP dissociation inhibitor n=2 Tax=Euplotes crassus TaxID=5936 RepID=A0AAD2DAZ5_EUPCR|nr:unnamed protein product [Moneuplotes crassus]
MKKMDLNNEGLDFVILGTGLTETLLGTDLSLGGKKVLHVDLGSCYGGALSNYNLKNFVTFVDTWKEKSNSNALYKGSCLRNFQTVDKLDLHEELIKSESRNFSLDLIPKVIFSKSKSVNYCLDSGVSFYLEFQNIINNFIFLKGRFMKIPFSKSEVFMNTDLSLAEKRNLVKIINHSLHFYDKYGEKEEEEYRDQNSTHTYEKDIYVTEKEDAEFESYRDKPIAEYLEHHKIDSGLCYILLYALGNVNESQEKPEDISLEKVSTLEFFARISKYLRSIGYYGHTPMLMANYGTSEYVQSFSRVGSLFGAIYMLNDTDLSISDPVIVENKLESIELSLNETPLRPTEGFIVGKEYEHLFTAEETSLFTEETCYPIVCQRMVIVSHIQLSKSEKGPPIFSIPPKAVNEERKFDLDNKHPIRIIQQGFGSGITPRGFYCYHISMIQNFEHKDDFSVLLELKDLLFGHDSVEVIGEGRQENKDVIIQTMMDIIERKKQEEERRNRFNKQKEQEMLDKLEEERQIQEAIKRSLQESEGTIDDQQQNDGKEEVTKVEEEKKEEPEEEEIKIYEYSDLASSDIIYSCVYTQYCRKPDTTPGSKLTKDITNAWVIEDATFDLDLDEYFKIAEEFNKEHLRDKGGQAEFLKRENLPKEEVYGADSEKSDDMLDELEKDIFGDTEDAKEQSSVSETANTDKQDEAEVKVDEEKPEQEENTEEKEAAEDVDDLLDDLLEDN